MRYLVYALTIGAVVAGGLLWLQSALSTAHQSGVDQQVARDIAKANQEIATRRETDAKFDSQDARALCDSMGLEWVWEDERSFCR